jgi:hypothetical protein
LDQIQRIRTHKCITATTDFLAGLPNANNDMVGSSAAPLDPLLGALTFPASTLTQTLTVDVLGELIDENDETFSLSLSAPIAAAIADSEGVATIQDNEAPPPPSASATHLLPRATAVSGRRPSPYAQRAQQPAGGAAVTPRQRAFEKGRTWIERISWRPNPRRRAVHRPGQNQLRAVVRCNN